MTKRFDQIVLLRNIAKSELGGDQENGLRRRGNGFRGAARRRQPAGYRGVSRTLRALRGTHAAAPMPKLRCTDDHHHVIGTDAFTGICVLSSELCRCHGPDHQVGIRPGISGKPIPHIQHGFEKI